MTDPTTRPLQAMPGTRARPPRAAGVFNRLTALLVRLGISAGANALLSVRGRKSGVLRTVPVTIVTVSGRRWVQSPFERAEWTRNLRAAGRATLTVGRRTEDVDAIALSQEEMVGFYRDVLGPYLARSPFTRMAGRSLGLTTLTANPEAAAATHAVFELRPRA